MIIAGLMSGSSLDGLDVAICNFESVDDRIKWDLIESYTAPFSDELFTKLSTATTLTAQQLAQLDYDFAKFCANAIRVWSSKNQHKVEYIASHGHTVYHAPHSGYSVQIGNGGVIAAQCEIPCISDFRMNDIALGGQGAPIVPIVEQVLFPEVKCFLNLGGIVNISIHGERVIAYDICPCNQILNLLAQKLGMDYDHNGEIASSGNIDHSLLKAWNNLSYFSLKAPKSLDNSWVKGEFYSVLKTFDISTKDALATMVAFITQQIILALDQGSFSNQHEDVQIMVTGGGALNKFLLNQIEMHLPEHMSIKTIDRELVEAKEAILMALMGFLRINQKVNTIPTATGARRGTCAGAIYMP